MPCGAAARGRRLKAQRGMKIVRVISAQHERNGHTDAHTRSHIRIRADEELAWQEDKVGRRVTKRANEGQHPDVRRAPADGTLDTIYQRQQQQQMSFCVTSDCCPLY
jgi:hypothetical protein